MSDGWKRIKVVFHAGLLLAVVSVVVAAALQGKVPAFPFVYALVGVAHVIVLGGLIQFTVEERQRVSAAGWLYSAGFVHTLAGLGVTLAIAASSQSNSQVDIAAIIAPMGAAVLPHAIAVWFGHTFEHSAGESALTLEESILRALADESIGARQALRALYSERLDSLQKEVAELREHLRLMEEVRVQSKALAVGVQGEIDKVGRAAKSLATGLSDPADRIATALREGASAIQEARTAADRLKEAVAQTATAHNNFATEVRTATAVVGDLKELQQSIVELLSSAVFRQEGKPVP